MLTETCTHIKFNVKNKKYKFKNISETMEWIQYETIK